MPRSTQAAVDRDLRHIETLIANNPAGIGRPALERALAEAGHPIPWRTLLRRLDALAELGRIVVTGEARRTRYHSVEPVATPEPEPRVPRVAEPGPGDTPAVEYVSLSPAGAAVRDLVRRPLSARKPVGYDVGFLNRYEPGRTWYLAEETRRRLHAMGRTPDAERPAGTYAREIIGNLLIDLSWASSRLEGNTYTRLDTKRLIELGEQAEGKDAKDAQMILNHKRAIELLVDQADLVGFNRYTFTNLHSALAQNLVGSERDEGRLRTGLVSITGSTYMPVAIPQRIEELFDLLLAKADAISDPFEQAFFIMVQLPYLQPFIDVNKRTSRLGANLPLIKANLCPLSFVDVPERAYIDGLLGVYELNRVELLRDVFLWAYQRSCERYLVVRGAMGTPDPIRLRYHTALAEVVRDTVLAGNAPSPASLRTQAVAHGVATGDVDAFVEIAERLLVDLHEGAIARYGLRPSDFRAWESRVTPQAAQ